MNGIPEMLLLRILSQEEMYGYQLVSTISKRSEEVLNFGEGCIYPILHRLSAEGYITSRREVVEGRPRHYYRATTKGKKKLDSLQTDWNRIIQGTQIILGASYV